MKLLYNPPLLLKAVFPNSVWNTKNKILVTFDDGPIPETTELILQKLDEHKIKALFFCVGDNIRKYPFLAEKLISHGHTIGNHAFNHKIITKLSDNDFYFQVNSFNQFMKENFDYDVKYFRPPHGKINFSKSFKIKNLGMKNIMWSLMTYDYKNDLNIVKLSLSKYLKKNSIIVLHDSLKSQNIILESIDFICEEAAKKGFGIGEPSECLN